MPEEKIVNDLVAELIAHDDALGPHEEKLRKAVTALLAAKPDVPRDQNFYANLRKQLLNEFSHNHMANNAPSSSGSGKEPAFAKLHKWLTAHPVFALAPAIVGVLLIAVIVAPKGQLGPASTLNTNKQVASAHGVTVTKGGREAFGSLTATVAEGQLGSPSAMSSRTQSGGGGPAMGMGGGGQNFQSGSGTAMAVSADNSVASPTAPVSEKMVAGSDARMMPYPGPMTYFAYEYVGEPMELDEKTLEVLRRVKGNGASADQLRSYLSQLVDIGNLDDLKLQSFNGYEDKEYGFNVYADFTEETVSLNQYYPKWPHPENACRDDACYQANRIKESDVPSNEAAISMAEQFLAERGISKDGYGDPFVQDQWRLYYEAMTVKQDYWFPDAVSVVYPMMVGDEAVVDDGGNGFGMTVNVNARAKRADGLWNLSTRNYESSDYDAVTDWDVIKTAAERGGNWGWMPAESEMKDAKKVVLHLETPTRVLLRSWQYGGDGTGKELLVPALKFMVREKNTELGVPQQAVVIPLVQEILDQRNNGGQPIPLMKGGPAVDMVAPATSASTPSSAPATPPPATDPAATIEPMMLR